MDINRIPVPVVATVAALPFAVLGALELVHDQADVFTEPLDYAVEVVFAVAMSAAAAAYGALAALGRGLVRIAWCLASGGSTAVAVAAAATAAAGEETLGAVLGLGLLAVLLGLVAALVLDLRGRVAPRRSGVVLALALVGSVLVETTGTGGLVLGLGWFAVGRLAGARPPVLA